MTVHVRSIFVVLGVGALALTACAEQPEENGVATNGETTENGNGEDAPETEDDNSAEDDAAAGTECQFAPEQASEHEHDRDSLAYWAEELDLKVGNVAAGGGHHEDEDYPDPFPDDEGYREHLAEEYNSLTHENYLKWEFVQPEEGEYDFSAADAVVEFAQEHGMDVRGHALSWHSQNPEWLEEGDFSEDELREILEDHVRTVVSRYAGCIQQWDAANEIFDDDEDASIRDGEDGNIWIRELGEEILDDIFLWAHEEDPDALLFYNDYNVDGVNAKSDAYYELIEEQLDRGVPVHGFGSQTHLSMLYGFDDSYRENLERFADLGLHTAVTEIDVRGEVDEDDVMSQDDRVGAAERYVSVLEDCLAVDNCDSFTIWGTLDEHSWVPNTFEGEGDATLHKRSDDGGFERKPTYCAIQRTLVDAADDEASFDDDEAFDQCREVLEDYDL